MPEEICYWLFCWVPVDENAYKKIFGFAEFLAALALLAVLFTITDVRYKFRTAIVPGNLYLTSFVVMILVGAQALLTEVWIGLRWYVPAETFFSSITWQAMFGAIFLVTFGTWMFYAFIRPPIFGRRNAKQFAQTLFAYVLKANDDELNVIAHEIGRSARAMVRLTRPVVASFDAGRRARNDTKLMSTARAYALDLHYLIANRKFCRHIVAVSPVTVISFLEAAREDSERNAPISQFATNISIEAFANLNSFIYTEENRYDSGLIGHLKPVTLSLYSNYRHVEDMAKQGGGPFDIPYYELQKWGGAQYEAYSRLALMLFEDFAKETHGRERSKAFNEVFQTLSVKHSYSTYDGDDVYRSTEYMRLEACVSFVKGAVALLDEHGAPPDTPRPKKAYERKSIYDDLAHLMFDACVHASKVKRKDFTAWAIQHNAVWAEFFDHDNSETWSRVRKRLRHLLANEMRRMASRPQFVCVPLVGFCANVMGLRLAPKASNPDREMQALHRFVLWLIRKHYARLLPNQSRLAESMLVGGLTFDPTKFQIVKTYESGLSDVAATETLIVDGAFAPPQSVRKVTRKRSTR